jgi:hypothetical protein
MHVHCIFTGGSGLLQRGGDIACMVGTGMMTYRHWSRVDWINALR